MELFSFRADFLKDSVEILGEDLLTEAWGSMTPLEMLDYSNRLLDSAERFASARGIDLQDLDTSDIDSVDTKLDIVTSAARWCRFWAERGHVLGSVPDGMPPTAELIRRDRAR